jgi:putative N-acetylmannosamine-6-phosphate epimerase
MRPTMGDSTAGLFNRQQVDVDKARTALENHVATMARAGATVSAIHDDVRMAYVADSSSIFSSKLQQWMQAYTDIKSKVDALHASLSAADVIHNTSEMDASQYASAWDGGGSGYYHALSG